MIKRIRSLDNIPKWILFFGVVGSVWFFGQEIWFHRWLYSGDAFTMPWDRKVKGWTADWEWVFITTFLTAFFSYWVLFGLRKEKL